MLPKHIVNVEKFAVLTNVFRPDKSVSPIQSTNSLFTQKQAITISILLLLLGMGYTTQALNYGRELAVIEQRVDAVKSTYPKLQGKSNYVLKNLYASSHAIDSLQRRIRDRLKTFGKLSSKASKIDHLKIDTKGYDVLISVDKQHLEALKKYAKSKKLKVAKSSSGLHLRGAL